jgi:hypothetical protein
MSEMDDSRMRDGFENAIDRDPKAYDREFDRL